MSTKSKAGFSEPIYCYIENVNYIAMYLMHDILHVCTYCCNGQCYNVTVLPYKHLYLNLETDQIVTFGN